MKYRRLAVDELQELESEFVNFLAANTVTADDWEKLKTQKPDKAEQLLDIFSDIVFDKILETIRYLELKTPQDLRVFHCQEEKLEVLGLLIEGNTQFDFTQNLSPEQMLQQLQLSGASVKLYHAERTYRQERKQELFDLLQQGALISKDGNLYKTLESLRK